MRSAVVTNAGTVDTAPVIEVGGPTPASWFVANASQGRFLWINLAVAAGQTLEVDLRSRTATLDGDPVTGIVDLANSRWWTLSPGPNTVQASVVATIHHRNAFA